VQIVAMKFLLPLLFAALVTVSSGAPAPAGGATKAPKDSAKKEEPAKIEGVEVARASGGFLGVTIVGNNFKISFYNDKKKPVPADVDRAIVRWDPKGKVGREQAVLNPTGDGKALTGPKVVHPPYTFKLFITLLKDTPGSAEPVAGETFTIDFRA
jgi:hypothetical protein